MTKEAEVFLQYKGTDICLDFYCTCGAQGHFDGFFAHRLKCPKCNQEWVMPHNLVAHKPTPEDYPHEPQMLEVDDG